MSGSSDNWFEMNIEKENRANRYRENMTKELSINNMIRIMFEHHITKLSDSTVIKLGEQYLDRQ